jgi:hypothetical protein
MIRITRPVFAIVLSFVYSVSVAQERESPERAYRALADEFLASDLSWRPQEAVGLGLHEYDGKVTDLRRESIARQRHGNPMTATWAPPAGWPSNVRTVPAHCIRRTAPNIDSLPTRRAGL